MNASQVRLDIREGMGPEPVPGWPGEVRFFWVVQTTLPVRDRFRSCDTFETRAAAVRDYEETIAVMDWMMRP